MAEDSALVMHRSWFDPNCELYEKRISITKVVKTCEKVHGRNA